MASSSSRPKLIHGLSALVGGYSLIAGLKGLLESSALGDAAPGAQTNVDFGPRGKLVEPPMTGDGKILNKAQLTTVRNIDERVRYIIANIQSGSLSPNVKSAAAMVLNRKCQVGSQILWCVGEKNSDAEVAALFYALRQPSSPLALRYTRDHAYVDQFMACDQLLKAHIGDCFVNGTLVLRDDHKLVPVETLRVGDRIWGKDRWSAVTQTWDRGTRKTWLVRLNNGSAMRLTPEHKVWTYRCVDHAEVGKSKCTPKRCPLEKRLLVRVAVSELRKGDKLVRPDRIPFGQGTMDGDTAWMTGVYVADGWSERNGNHTRVSISGKDGHPKAVQKKRVEAICARLGIPTRMHPRYIALNGNGVLVNALAALGNRAPQKHVPSLNLDEGAALPMLEGVLADATKNTHGSGRTLTTTSRRLFVEARVLAKMAGVTCGERFIVDHGGLGENPIWRLQLWGKRVDARAEKTLAVKEIVRDDVELDCCDIETDDHQVWLPEADWTVSQCDDGTALLGALLMNVGYPVRCRIIQDRNSSDWSHIYLLVNRNPTGQPVWAALDWSEAGRPEDAGQWGKRGNPYWEVQGAAECARTGRPAGLVVKVKDYECWRR